MSPTEEKRQVVVLQSVQPIGSDLSAAFPAELFDVRILTSGRIEGAVRPGVSATVPVEATPLEQWAQRLREIAGGGPVEPVTNDEYCLEACAALRRELRLPPRLDLRVQAGEDAAAPAPTGMFSAWLWFPRSAEGGGRPRAPRCEHRLEALPATSPIAHALLAWDPDLGRLREEVRTALRSGER